MSTHQKTTLALTTAALLLALAGASAQGALTATLHPSGMIRVGATDGEIAMIELNAHGPSWQHAAQETATATVTDLPGGAGKQFSGTLPVPNTDGGAIDYVQTVKTLPRGLRIEYEVTMAQTMRLNGLQVSLNLPVARYGGTEVMISQPHGDPDITGLPAAVEEGRTQLWSGSGSKIEAGKDTPATVTMELRAATDVIIQDLREWEHDVFEIRLPAIMEGDGREVSAGDRFHLDLTVTFAGPVTLAGP